MRIRMRVLDTSLRGLQFESDKQTILVGRSGDSNLILQQRSVSRQHAVVSVRDGRETPMPVFPHDELTRLWEEGRVPDDPAG